MDCKTFDDHLMDELYGELDEVTSAAMARHAESCSSSPSCRSKLAGLRSTREAVHEVGMPYVDPPDDLEDRILAATRDARPVIPLRRKMGGAVSWAGAWAMRPQTAMAAVFLLMIGSSLALFRTHRSRMESKAVAVSELGTPEPSPAGPFGDNGPLATAAAPPAAAAPVAAAAAAPAPMPAVPMATSGSIGSFDESNALRGGLKDDVLGKLGSPAASSASNGIAYGYGSKPSPKSAAVADPEAHDSPYIPEGDRKTAVASRSAAAPSKQLRQDGLTEGSSGGSPGAPADKGGAMPASPPNGVSAATQAASSDDAFTRGQQAYTARRYDEARDNFDAAASGNVAAALWAARSVRDGNGCAGAVSRFDDVVNRAPSSAVGFDARLEGGRCYRALGQTDVARARLVPLLTVPSHAKRAQAELAAMAPPPAAAAPPAVKRAAPGNTSGL